jgi:hypothetical protein
MWHFPNSFRLQNKLCRDSILEAPRSKVGLPKLFNLKESYCNSKKLYLSDTQIAVFVVGVPLEKSELTCLNLLETKRFLNTI